MRQKSFSKVDEERVCNALKLRVEQMDAIVVRKRRDQDFIMRDKHIFLVSALLIATFCLPSGLMYYFSRGKCPVGTFQCQNSTKCISQRNWCNGIPDCSLGDDESKDNCFNEHGIWDWRMKDRDGNWRNTEECDVLDAPVECFYYEYTCSASCENHTDVPQDFSINVTEIFLTNNFLTRLSRNALSRYPQLRILHLDYNNIIELEKGAFLHQTELFFLFLDGNKIQEIQPGHLTGLNELDILTLNENKIMTADFSDLDNSTALYLVDLRNNMLMTSTLKLPRLPTLSEIILDGNRFESITEDLFAGCPALKSLSMKDNRLSNVDERAFRNLQQLTELNLAYNKIITLPPNVFEPVNNLSKLFNFMLRNYLPVLTAKYPFAKVNYGNITYPRPTGFNCNLSVDSTFIDYNPIAELPINLFNPLNNLLSLGLEGINMGNMNKDVFDDLPNLDSVHLEKFQYCMAYASKVQNCWPTSDGVSSTSHLLGKPMLRAAVWSISCVTCLGNGLVLWGRFTAKDENRILSVIIRNLAVSDMLMGIYLFIIAIEDAKLRDNYKEEASAWMSSWLCTFLGALAMTSSEVSMLILSFMSVERFILISTPLKCRRAITCQTTFLSMIIIWITGLILAVVPVIHWRSSTRFYGVNGMCFPLYIDDPYSIGWEYSAFIYLGLNLTGLLIIGYVYANMFVCIWRTRHATPLSVGDSEFALRFFLIVLTDAACWAPIIALKIFAMIKHPIPPYLHSWIVIFILPVNSAINPLLYTFTTSKFRERLNKTWCGKAFGCVWRKYPKQDSRKSSISVINKNAISVSIWTDFDRKKMPLSFH